ncbi:MAG: hypothetical protein Q9225_003654 [Loekoesia sp. 1 TL-2023]
MTHSGHDEDQSSSKTNLWRAAILATHNDLPPELKDFGTGNVDTITELQSICQIALDRKAEARKKEWRIHTNTGKTVVLRDLWGKVLGWVKRFQTIGDIAIQADAGLGPIIAHRKQHSHTSNARSQGVQAAIGEHETYAQMLEGMEFVSSLIVQYAVVEQLYTFDASQLASQLQKSLTELYISILQYLIRSHKYFGYNKFKRALSGINQSMNGEVSQLQKKINEVKVRVDADALLVSHDLTKNGINIIGQEQKALAVQADNILESQALMKAQQDQVLSAQEYQAERLRVLVEIHESWQRPLDLISNQILGVRDEVEYAQITRISNWLSSIRMDARHAAIKDGRLPSSGMWLLQHPTYLRWADSPYSSALWMHGLLGTGKTNLVSTIIDTCQDNISEQKASARLAYFYCTRNKAGSGRETDLYSGSEPVEVFRSLLKQLARSEKNERLDIVVTDKYQQLKTDADEPRQLTLPECVELIISISMDRATTIIIDALDECRSAEARDLINGLNEILVRSPKYVKIFMSTRPVSAVVDYVRDKNYASLEVTAEQNSSDISSFIEHELDRRIREKQLLHGNVPEVLRAQILSNLSERAGSMFWYASLQLNLLCDPTAEDDESSIRAKLTKLPSTLKDAYNRIIEEVTSTKNSERSRDVAQNTLKWLLCAQEPMPSTTFLEAISLTHDQNLSAEWVSSICRSLVSLNKENDKFEFAHLSVREHLEQEQYYSSAECHLVAAESCLRALENLSRSNAVNRTISDSAKAFSRYAFLYWPFHFQGIDFRHIDDRKERLKNKLNTLLVPVRDVSPIFEQWISHVEAMASGAAANHERLLKLESLKAVPATPLFAASVFGFADLVKQFRLIHGYNLEQRNVHNQTALCLAVENDQLETVKAFLEDIPRAKIPSLDINHVNLCAVEQYEDFNLSSPPKVICFASALQAAAAKGNMPVAKYLLEKGARIDLVAGYYGSALQAAALNGHVELVKFFLQSGAEPNSQGGYYGNALQAAAVSGNRATVSALLDYGALVQMPGGHYGTAFMAAIDSRSREVVELLLYNQAHINKASKNYGTPLQRAADLDSFDIVELLVTRGAKMNLRSSAETHNGRLSHTSALAIAAWGGHSKIVSVLLRNGAQADISRQGKELHLLHQAALRGMVDLAEYCIDACGCDVNMVTNQTPTYIRGGIMTPLSFACSEGHFQMARYLLSKGASLEFDGDHYTTLWLAARRGHSAIVQLLLETSAGRQEVNNHSEYVDRRTPNHRHTALYEAARVGSLEAVDLLLTHGASLQGNKHSANPIHVAVKEHRLQVVGLLMDRALSEGRYHTIDAQDVNGLTPLFYAIMQDDLDMVVLLLNVGANTAICDLEGESVLHFAGRLNRARILRELFKNRDRTNPLLDLCNGVGNTPFIEALTNNSYHAARVFIEDGGPLQPHETHANLLHQAVAGDESLVRKYIAIFKGFPKQLHGFLGSVDVQGRTALHIAAEMGHPGNLELLLHNGAPVDAVDANSQTALSSAIINCHDHCAKILIGFAQRHIQRADRFLDHRNAKLNTALHEAVIYRRASTISLLIDSGANITLLDHEDRTALHLAIRGSLRTDADLQLTNSITKQLLQKARSVGKLRPFIDSQTGTGMTAFLQACGCRFHNVAQMLLDYGANCFLSTKSNTSPLHIAAVHGDTDLAAAMLDKLLETNDLEQVQGFIDQRNDHGMTALNDSCRRGHLGMVDLLLGKFKANYLLANVKQAGFVGYTPLHFAVSNNDTSLVREILRHVTQDPDAREKQLLLDAYQTNNGKLRTALIDAAATDKPPIMTMLLNAGASYLVPDDEQCTALHHSVRKNDTEAVGALLDFAFRDEEQRRSLFLNHRNQYGKTALIEAAETGFHLMIEALLSFPELDYALEDLDGFTALHWGVFRDNQAVVKLLLQITSKDETDDGKKYRDFINHRGHQNSISALFDAASVGRTAILSILLKFGADYDTFDDAGHHPLHLAVQKNLFDVVDIYLSSARQDTDRERYRGFVMAKEPESGLNIWELAERQGNPRMKEILKSFRPPALDQLGEKNKSNLSLSRSKTG